MKEYAQVIRLEGDHAVVLIRRNSACGKCGACGMGAKDELVLTLPNKVEARAGDTVVLDLSSGRGLSAALIAYGFPLLMMIIGAVLGNQLPAWLGWRINADAAAGLGALLLTLLAWGMIKVNEKRIRRLGFSPRLEGVAARAQQQADM